MSLDTLANVKTALTVSVSTDDTLLTQLMSAADSFIAEHTGRDFEGGSFTETQPAGGTRLFLSNFPIASVISLRVDPDRVFGSDTERDPSTYVVHADRGVIESLNGPFLQPYRKGSDDWPEAVQIEYTTATGSVPSAIQQAYADLIGHWYRQAKTNADANFLMLTELDDGTTVKTYSWSLTRGLSVPPGVTELLAKFRVPTI